MDPHVSLDTSALKRAFRLQEMATAVGIDWPDVEDVWSRINEELAEAKAASEDLSILKSRIQARTAERTETLGAGVDGAHELLVDDLGELLFAVVDVCRMLGVDPCQALDRANGLFGSCLQELENRAREEGRTAGRLADLQLLWDQAKRRQREKTVPSNIIWPKSGRSGAAPQDSTPLKKTARA